VTGVVSRDPGHDIVVIGASAGGIRALTALIAKLQVPLPAALFVVQHIAPDRPSVLPNILNDVGDLLAFHPKDGERISHGRIYVAPPDHHLLLTRGRVRVLRGPQENRFRPSIDALFRSAARAYGPRVIGVVLTGSLTDGTVGMQAIRKRGGITIVQEPAEAEYPSMPRTALRYVDIDHRVPLAGIAPLLARLVAEAAPSEAAYPVPPDVEFESRIAEQRMDTSELLASVERIGTRTVYTCPECNGSMWLIGDDEPLRLRCHVGHAFTDDVFLALQTQNLENALWSAVRMMEEKVTMTRRRAAQSLAQRVPAEAQALTEYAHGLDEEIAAIRHVIEHGFAVRRSVTDDNLEMNRAPYRPASTRTGTVPGGSVNG